MDERPDEIALALLTAIRKQSGTYAQVRDLSEAQNRAIAGEQTESLLSILGKKQDLIHAIDAQSSLVDGLRSRYEPLREQVDAELRHTLETALDELKKILGRIVELEDEGKAMIQSRQGEQGDSLLHIQKGKAMHKAYGSPQVRPDARFKDRNA